MAGIILVGEQVRRNKQKTVMLIAMFFALILLVSAAIGYYVGQIPLAVAGGAVFAAGYTMINVSVAKHTIMKHVKGTKVTEQTHPELVRQVHGLAIAAGIPMPDVYVVPSRVPNAFATGMSPQSSAVGVTQGLLELMNRQELEGVIAHEISHIKNYDIRVTCVAMSLGMVFVVLSGILFDLVRFDSYRKSRPSRNQKNGTQIFIVLLAAAVLLAVFSRFISPMILMAISRKREYMADADAVRLCSNNEGLISALKKLRDYSASGYTKSQLKELGGREMLSAYIFNPFKGLFSTHPDINERIAILERSY